MMGLFRKRSTAAILEQFHEIADELEDHAQFSQERRDFHAGLATEHNVQASMHHAESERAQRAAAKIRELVS